MSSTALAPRFSGVRLRAPDRSSAWDIAHQIADGEYAYPGLTPRRGQRVIDIGANIGIYSLWAERRGATVIAAYEPGPDAFDALCANVTGRRVTPIHAAVVGCTDSGTIDLFLHHERSTRNTVIGVEIGDGSELTDKVSVPAVPIGHVLKRSCDLLKLDCEGGEFDILLAATDDELRSVAGIVLEFHRLVGEPATLIARLTDAGFDAEILAGGDADQAFGVIGAVRAPTLIRRDG